MSDPFPFHYQVLNGDWKPAAAPRPVSQLSCHLHSKSNSALKLQEQSRRHSLKPGETALPLGREGPGPFHSCLSDNQGKSLSDLWEHSDPSLSGPGESNRPIFDIFR